MKKISIIAAIGAGIFLMAGCVKDNSGLEERISTLESQVAMLETSISTLNGNIEALSKLASASTINSVEEKDGKYTIVLSNGESIVVDQGSVGVGYAPIMSVDKDGYWMADYQDGKGAQYITDADGKKVNYKGDDGITPKFSVDAEGYWTVSYDGGKTFAQVKDVNGNPVKAVASADAEDSYFKDVKVEEDMFILTLKNGDVYRIPVVKDFLVSIKDVETVQVFKAGEMKAFSVELKGVASSILTAPAGWTATLSESLLSVTAPGEATKATVADNSTDVSILAISLQGFAAVAKVKVQLDGASSDNTPVASVTAGEVTYNSATFTVTVENATSWKYIAQKSSEEAPGMMKIASEGKEGTGTSVVLSDLEEKTSYTLYVLPVNGDKAGSIASATITTAEEPVITYEDNYTAYTEGKAINIAGIKYDKATYGEPVLVCADEAGKDLKATLAAGGVVFLEESGDNHFALSGSVTLSKSLVLISRYTSKPVTLEVIAGQVLTYNAAASGAANCGVVFKLIKFNSLEHNNYLFNVYTNPGGNFHFDGCEFRHVSAKPLFYSSNAVHRFPASIRFTNCYFEIRGTAGGRVDYISFGNQANKYVYDVQEVIYDNNIFYTPTGNLGLTLFTYGYATASDVPLNLSLTFTNNTLYDVRGSNNMIQVNSLKEVTIKNNLFWAASTNTLNSYIVRVGVNAADPSPVDVCDNITYGKPTILFNTGGKFKLSSGNNATQIEEDPLADAEPSKGDFTPVAAYKNYGAQR